MNYLWVVCALPLFISGLMGCTSTGSAGAPSSVEGPVTIEFKGAPGQTVETRYFSHARILSYGDRQLLRDRSESVDFTVNTHFTEYDVKNQLLRFEARTVRKDGTVPLHDFAFPELNEVIAYEVRSNGEVLKAGSFPRQSLFFVPSLPIPDRPVSVGDTWSMEHTWTSAKEGIPLSLEVVGILKNVLKCDGGKRCADIEISGHVSLVREPTAKGARFESRVWGRMLFSIERGDVVWSEMRSQEEMGVQSDRMVVSSCMVSETKLGAKYKTEFNCEPGEKPVDKIPAL